MIAQTIYHKTETKEFQPLTLNEMKQLTGHVWGKIENPRHPKCGRMAQMKVTSVKTWKRQPERVEVHCKYGMYEYITFSEHDTLYKEV